MFQCKGEKRDTVTFHQQPHPNNVGLTFRDKQTPDHLVGIGLRHGLIFKKFCPTVIG
jgi:hypothetical protein